MEGLARRRGGGWEGVEKEVPRRAQVRARRAPKHTRSLTTSMANGAYRAGGAACAAAKARAWWLMGMARMEAAS